MLGCLVFEGRPDDPTTSTEDFDREFVYDVHGRLSQVRNADCVGGSVAAETYAYEDGASEEPLQLEERMINAFTVASGACVVAPFRVDAVEYGDSGAAQQGSIVEVVRDPVDAVPAVNAFVYAPGTGEQVASSSGSAMVASGVDVLGRTVQQTVVDGGSSSAVVRSFAGGDSEVASVQRSGAPVSVRLEAPNGWVVAEYRGTQPGRYYVSDANGSPVMEIETEAVVVATQTFDGSGAVVTSTGEFTFDLSFEGEVLDPVTGIVNSYDPDLRLDIAGSSLDDIAWGESSARSGKPGFLGCIFSEISHCNDARQASNAARDTVKKIYPKEYRADNGRANAALHALASAYLVNELLKENGKWSLVKAREVAENFGNAHEDNCEKKRRCRPDQSMDLWNNEQGRRSEYGRSSAGALVARKTLLARVLDRMRDRTMKRIVVRNGHQQLRWTLATDPPPCHPGCNP